MLKPGPWLLLAVAIAAVLSGTACTQSAATVTPELPPGFMDTPLPNTDVSGYLYVSQESPFRVAGQRLARHTDGEDVAVPAYLELRALRLITGPSAGSLAGTLVLANDAAARDVANALSGRPGRAVRHEGDEIQIVAGDDQWAKETGAALRDGDGVTVQDFDTEIWRTFRTFPESPPSEPVAAGFSRVGNQATDHGLEATGVSLSGLAQALGTVQVTSLVYAVYSESDLRIDESIDHGTFDDLGISMLVAMQSDYPGFLLSFFLNTFADRVGLEKNAQVSGNDVFTRESGGYHMVLKPVGSTMFLAMATDRERSEELIASVLEQQAE